MSALAIAKNTFKQGSYPIVAGACSSGGRLQEVVLDGLQSFCDKGTAPNNSSTTNSISEQALLSGWPFFTPERPGGREIPVAVRGAMLPPGGSPPPYPQQAFTQAMILTRSLSRLASDEEYQI